MGREKIIAARWAGLPVTKGFIGSTTVIHTAPVYDDFTGRVGPLADGRAWIDHGPATDYRAVIEEGKVRVNLPDALPQATEAISYTRYADGIASGEDGYIECRVFSIGASVTDGDRRYSSVVFGKVDESFADGVGLRMAGSHLSITVRRNSIDTQVASFGTYASGDMLRMSFSGSYYSVYCNGQLRGTWNDSTALVATGAEHRYLGIRVHGAQEQSVTGPRRFSPALDYVEYS